MADNPNNNCRASEPDLDTDNLDAEVMPTKILISNSLDVHRTIRIPPPNGLTDKLSSSMGSTPLSFLSLPFEIRVMIYHHVIGNCFLHIDSNRDTLPDKIIQCECSDEYPQISHLESKTNKDNCGFPKSRITGAAPGSLPEVVHCQGSVVFHNKICTSHDSNVGNRPGYWSLSREIKTGSQTVEQGIRLNADNYTTESLKFCPCTLHPKTSLSLNLLQTCKQIHKEAALIPYESNTFIFQEIPTFAAFFGLVFPHKSDSNDNPTFASDRSHAIRNMRNLCFYSKVTISNHWLFVTRFLRASLPLLTSLRTLRLTLDIALWEVPPFRSRWEIEDCSFGMSRSVKKITVDIPNKDALGDFIREDAFQKTPVVEKQEFAEKLIERMLKEDGFTNEKVQFNGPL